VTQYFPVVNDDILGKTSVHLLLIVTLSFFLLGVQKATKMDQDLVIYFIIIIIYYLVSIKN